jgi:RNA polymerase sigma factor (sigma-70 family)
MASHLRTLAARERGDGQLLAQFAGGADEAAFAEIFHRHGKLVLGVCRRVLGAGPDSDDAFQATFVVLARKAASVRKPQALASWLYGVAYRVASELRKQRACRRRHEGAAQADLADLAEPRAVHVDPGLRAGWREVAGIVDEELQRVPAADRTALVLCLLQGMSHSEAAEHLGWPLGTLKTRVERGRQLLRRRLARRGLACSAAALAEQPALAVPPGLVRTTLGAAARRAGSAEVRALAERVLHTPSAGSVRVSVLGLVTACLVGLGTAAVVLTGGGEDRPPDPPVAAAAQAGPPPAGRDAPDGPLPPAGVIARFGAVPFHNGARIEGCELSPDGKQLATLSRRSATVWDPATGRVRHRFFFDIPAWPSWSDGLAFSPDGTALACRPRRDRIIVWNLRTGKERRRFTVKPALYSFAFFRFSADGKAVITQLDQEVVWLNVATGATDRRLPRVRIKELSPDDRTFAAVDGARGRVHVGDARTGKVTHTLPVGARPDHMEQGLLFLPDGVTLAVVHHQSEPAGKAPRREVQFWDVATGRRREMTWSLPDETDGRQTYRLTVSHDGKVLYFPEDRKNLRRFSLQTGKELPPMPVYGDWVTAAFPHPDGKTLFSVHLERIRRWDLVTGTPTSRDPDFQFWQEMPISPDGRWLALRAYQGSLDLIDVESRRAKRVGCPKSTGPVLAFSPDGKVLAVNRYSHIAVLRIPELTEFKKLSTENTAVGQGSLLFSPDGRYLASRTDTAHLCLFDLTTDRVIWSLDEILGVRFTPDGKQVLVWSRNRPDLRLLDVATRKPQFEVKLPPDRGSLRGGRSALPSAVAFAPDGRALVVAMTGGHVCLLDPASGRERARFLGVPTDAPRGLGRESYLHATALAFSADGQWLAVGGGDGFVRLWEVSTRRELHRLHGHEGGTAVLAFSADGRRLLTCGDGEALLWDLRPRQASGKTDALADLLSEDGPTVYRAVWRLAADAAAPALLRRQIPPRRLDARPQRVARLVADLDSPLFAVRDAAQRALAELQGSVRPALLAALEKKQALETTRRIRLLLAALDGEPRAGELRMLRAVRALELHRGAEARQVLREWSGGTPGLRLTEAARAALARLQRSQQPGR